jgi:hypothetical protein
MICLPGDVHHRSLNTGNQRRCNATDRLGAVTSTGHAVSARLEEVRGRG